MASNKFIVKNGLVASGLSYPTSDGTAGYFLKTDGAGNLSWAAGSGGGGSTSFTMGSGVGTYKPSGLLYANIGSASGGAGAEATLFSYTLPANSFSANGQVIRIAFAFTGGSASSTGKIYFGTSSVTGLSTGFNGTVSFGECYVTRINLNTQSMNCNYTQNFFNGSATIYNNGYSVASSTQTETNAIVIKITAAIGATVERFTVEYLTT